MADSAAPAVPAAAPAAPAPAAEVDEFPHKVFAGNLSFKTSEDELRDFFAPAGAVAKVNIITRGQRSLGYGFVAFASLAECEAAVEQCHKKELGGREVNVEVAKPKAELAAARKERLAAHASANNNTAAAAGGAARAPRKRKGRRFAKKDGAEGEHKGDAPAHPHHHAADSPKGGDDDKPKEEGGDDEKSKKKRKPRKKKPKKPRDAAAGDAPAAGAAGAAPGERPAPRPKRVPTGEPSKTTVFVANLPFTLDDAGLSAVFKDFKVKSAKVVLRRGTGRSKGFGFVEFEEEAEQQKVLAAPVFVSESRELNIKVALSDEKPEDKKEEEEASTSA